MTRTARLTRGLGALLVLGALTGGVPWALCHYIGWPLPRAVPSWAQIQAGLSAQGIPDLVLLKALAIVVWAGWAVLVTAVLSEAIAAARGRAAPTIRAAGALQPLAAHLVAAVALAVLALPRPGPAPAGQVSLAAVLPVRPAATISLQLTDTNPPSSANHASKPGAATPATRPYVVQRRDTLWGIADRQLGDPLRWSQIYALNQGRTMPDGRVFDDANRIWPGWTLQLPADAPPAATTDPAAPVPPPAARHPAPRAPTPAVPRPTPAPAGQASNQGPDGSPSAHPPAAAQHLGSVVVSPVELPSGSVVGGSFAAGVAAALLLGRLRRRHAYHSRPPQPGRCVTPPDLGSTLRRLAAGHPTANGEGGEDIPPLRAVVSLPSDDPARREQPDLIEVATRAGEPVSLTLTELGGVALTGSGADGVARAWLTAVLVRAGPLAAEILITAAARDRLLPDLPEASGLRVLPDSDALLRHLEVETVARTRQVTDTDTDIDDVVAYRRAHPYEPLPTLIAVTGTVPPDQAGRWQTTLNTGTRLGLGALILAPGGAAATHVDVRADRTAAVDGPARITGRLADARLFAMTASEATDVLAALTDSERRPSSEDFDNLDHNPGEDAGRRSQTGPIVLTQEPDALDEPSTEPWPEPVTAPTRTQDSPSRFTGAPAPEAADEAATVTPITVRLLGPYLITVDGQPVSTGLRTVAKELLAWYLLRPDGATVEAAVDALWPDTDPKNIHRQFWLAASNLRTRLRSTDRPDVKVLLQAGEVYRPQADVIGCDLWDFQAALGRAARAADDTTVHAALERAVDAYRGDFAGTTDYLWAEPVRRDLHRRALDAHLRLAQLDEHLGNPQAALVVLEKAITLDGIAEEPYRRLMVVQGRLGRLDAVRATWRAMQRRLADLDIDPEPRTLHLYRTLIAQIGGAGSDRHLVAHRNPHG